MAIKVRRKAVSLERDLDNAKMRLEKQLIESQIDYLDNIVDKRSMYFEEKSQEWWTPMGADRDSDLTVPFWDEESHRFIRRRSRWAAMHSPYAQNFLNNLCSFVIGKGHKYTVITKEGYKTSDLVGYTRNFQRWVNNLLRRNKWAVRQQEAYRRKHRDGERFIRLFPNNDGYTYFRFVCPSQVYTPDEYEKDDSADFGIKTDPDDIETVETYFVNEEEVDYFEIQHVKANVDLDVKRGLSSLYVIGENIDRARNLLRNMSVVAAMQAAIAMIRKHKNKTSTAISNFVQNTSTYRMAYPDSMGGERRLKKYRPGSIIDTNDQTEHEFPSVGLNPAAPISILAAENRAMAASKSLPEYMIGSDASNANYSSTMVAEAPGVRYFESEQTLQIESDLELIWAAADYAINAGKLPPEVRQVCEIQVEAPMLVTRDPLQVAQADDIYLRNRVKDPQSTSQSLGLDPKKVQNNWREFDDANPDLQPLPLPTQLGA